MSEPRSYTDFLNDIVVAVQKATEFGEGRSVRTDTSD